MTGRVVRAYVGVDWGTAEHAVCAVDPTGKVLWERTVKHEAQSLAFLCEAMLELGDGDARCVHVGIEVPHGVVVDTLQDRGFPTHSINPKQLDRFRDRFSPAGAKDDSRDAHVLADSLRTDGKAYRLLSIDRPEVVELREWSRMGDELRAEYNRLTNRVREQLRRYYPQFLKLGEDVGKDWVLDLWELIPTPDRARRVRETTIGKLLRQRRIRKTDAATVHSVLREPTVMVSPGTEDAACTHIRFLADRLRVLNRQLKECGKALERLCDAVVPPADEGAAKGERAEHHDVDVLRSTVGIGSTILATMLGEAWWAIEARDLEALRTLGGVAPVTKRSGKRLTVVMRQACNPRLRNALYHWGRVAIQKDPQSRHRYAKLRLKGHSHGRALRTVTDRLLTVLCAMLRDGTLYDAERRKSVAYKLASNG